MANMETDRKFDELLEEENIVELSKAINLTKEIKTELKDLSGVSREEIKMLVKLYYQQQKYRKALREQIRSIENGEHIKNDTPANVKVLDWLLLNTALMEKGINDTLEIVCNTDEVGRWLMNIKGIGPVLAAGLLAFYDVEGKDYATQFISYGGLNNNNREWLGKTKSENIINEVMGTRKKPTDEDVALIAAKTKWSYDYLARACYNEKKEKVVWTKDKLIKACSKIPYNKELKTHLYKVGCSFQWRCNDKDSLYGMLFSERRVRELAKNENGDYADQAAAMLKSKSFDKTTIAYKAYSEGKLPLAHINARAMRWAEKIFVCHLFEEMYRVKYDKIPPRFYVLEHPELYTGKDDYISELHQHNREILPEVPYTLVSSEK